MEEKVITYIEAAHIRPHPENPRKNLGDLSELVESIRKNGVLQNLTVIPVEGEPGEYMTLIGHRRYAAGTQAGIEKFPCQIAENLTPREQVSIMLEENMQRNDLTIWEQANGFQMMLDLGETEESIAEKTGFSKTTVRHRLNIAKLNQKVLQEKEKDECFQLSLKDLYELEKIPDVKTRDKILKESTSSNNLAQRAKSVADEIKLSARSVRKPTLNSVRLRELSLHRKALRTSNTAGSGKRSRNLNWTRMLRISWVARHRQQKRTCSMWFGGGHSQSSRRRARKRGNCPSTRLSRKRRIRESARLRPCRKKCPQRGRIS